jgi:hypothetical protein
MHIPKRKRIKDRAYLEWVAQQPCMACGGRGGDAQHPRGMEWGTGTGLKASDHDVVPLCRGCHDEYHRHGRDTFEAKHGSHAEMLERFLSTTEAKAKMRA